MKIRHAHVRIMPSCNFLPPKPVLWHTYLHAGDVYGSEEDRTEIVSIIDWQLMNISLLFLQISWLMFLKPSDVCVHGIVYPQISGNFEQLTSAKQEL